MVGQKIGQIYYSFIIFPADLPLARTTVALIFSLFCTIRLLEKPPFLVWVSFLNDTAIDKRRLVALFVF